LARGQAASSFEIMDQSLRIAVANGCGDFFDALMAIFDQMSGLLELQDFRVLQEAGPVSYLTGMAEARDRKAEGLGRFLQTDARTAIALNSSHRFR